MALRSEASIAGTEVLNNDAPIFIILAPLDKNETDVDASQMIKRFLASGLDTGTAVRFLFDPCATGNEGVPAVRSFLFLGNPAPDCATCREAELGLKGCSRAWP